MPLDDTTKGLLKKYYGNLPGPSDDTYDLANYISLVLSDAGVNTQGAIAVCYSGLGWWYVAFSPDLQRGISAKFRNSGQWLASKVKSYFKKPKSCNVWICFDVKKEIVDNFYNPGCAEKKIVSAIIKFGDSIDEISIVQHPAEVDVERLRNYQAVGDRNGMYIVPCDSCIGVARVYVG